MDSVNLKVTAIETDPIMWPSSPLAHAVVGFRDDHPRRDLDFVIGVEGAPTTIAISVGSGGIDFLRLDDLAADLRARPPGRRRLVVVLHNHANTRRKLALRFVFPGAPNQIFHYKIGALRSLSIFLPVEMLTPPPSP